ncbi:hypothetical protein DFH28DRAFT_879426 [Melampsora americana]|nr:hypothetical protein DFH28DRAFT_879426 [Melampsora americana]
MANLSINSTRVTRVKSPEPRPSSLPSKTASLNDTMGIPGWQIVHDGDLPVLTLSGGAQSLIGYGAVQSLRRRERNFELNTMELKRKSTLWNHSSKT